MTNMLRQNDGTCIYCDDHVEDIEGSDERDLEWTYQQWRCPSCGNWNDRRYDPDRTATATTGE